MQYFLVCNINFLVRRGGKCSGYMQFQPSGDSP